MFRTVMVPLNGAPGAEAAVPYAIDEARRHGAQLALIQIIPRPELAPGRVSRGGPCPQVYTCSEDERTRLIDRARRYLRTVIERYGLDHRTSTSVAIGDPYLRLRAETERYPAPLVVVAMTEATAGRPTAIADAARRLIRIGAIPVLIVYPSRPLPVTHGAPAPHRARDTRAAAYPPADRPISIAVDSAVTAGVV